MKTSHSCPELSEIAQTTNLQINITRDEDDWILHYKYCVPHETGTSGHSKYIGDMLSEVSLVIQYCPYCGEKL